MNNERIQLYLSIERLYRAFRTYRLSPDLEERVDTTELRNLTAQDIKALGSADLSGLSITDIKHLLPRVMEMLLTYIYPARPEAVLQTIGRTDWRCWQRNERSAIERFLYAGWCYLLAKPTPVQRIDQWLCASVQIADDVYTFIHELTYGWWSKPLPKAAHYARLIAANYEALSNGQQMANPYWESREEQMLEASRWIVSKYEINDLDEIISEHPYEPVSDDLRLAAYQLEELCELPHKERLKPVVPNASDFIREPRAYGNSDVEPIPPPPEDLRALSDAIDALYEVFEPYTRRPELERRMGSAHLKELMQADLADLAHDILITHGQPEDLKHFLPRMLELMLQPGWPIRPEGMMFKLLLADYYMWPEAERAAVDTYVKAVWPVLLSDPEYPVSAEEWLCGASAVIERGESPPAPDSGSMVVDKFMDFPDLWRTLCNEGSAPAMIHWARFIIANYGTLINGTKLRNRFWCNRPYEVPRALHWMLSADNVANYLHGESAKAGIPAEVNRALEYAGLLWEKRGKQRHGASDIAVCDPERALELARGIDDPWFRCQELAGVARNTSDAQFRDIALRESFAAGAETAVPNRIGKVSSWPLGVLLDAGPREWFRQELARLLETVRSEPHPYRRIDALNWFLCPAFEGAPELYREVIAEIGRGADEARGWRVAYLLLIGSETASAFDHEGAIEIAMMIRNLRTRRRALRAIGEQQLAERYY